MPRPRAEQFQIHLASVGGAFGGREDLSMQIRRHARSAHGAAGEDGLHERRKSFLGHVHRHPARIWMEHRANRAGRLVAVRARILIDGGAYASTTAAVTSNARPASPVGPIGSRTSSSTAPASTRTIRPAVPYAASALSRPASLQSADGQARGGARHRLCGAAPAERAQARRRPPTGQRIGGSLPVAEVIRRAASIPAPGAGGCPATRSASPAAPATPRVERASGRGAGLQSGSRTSATRRATTTSRRRASSCARTGAPRCTARRPRWARASATSSCSWRAGSSRPTTWCSRRRGRQRWVPQAPRPRHA